MEQEFYRGLAHRVRALAETADPFTRRRLLDLAKRYDAKGEPLRSEGPNARCRCHASRRRRRSSPGPARPDSPIRTYAGHPKALSPSSPYLRCERNALRKRKAADRCRRRSMKEPRDPRGKVNL